MSERNGRLPDDVLVRSELRRETSRLAHAASVGTAKPRPIGRNTRSGQDDSNKDPAPHSIRHCKAAPVATGSVMVGVYLKLHARAHCVDSALLPAFPLPSSCSTHLMA